MGCVAAAAGCSHREFASQADSVVPLPNRYDALTDPAAGATAPALQACNGLGLPAFEALLARQYESSFERRAALARAARAEALARQAGASRWPRVDASVSAERAESRIVGLDLPFANQGPSTQYRGSVAASWEIDVWRRLGNEAQAAVLDAASSAALYEATLVSLSSSLAEAWTGVLARRETLDLLDEQSEASEKFLRLTRLRFAQGQTAAFAVAQQQLQLESLRTQRAQTLAGLREAENQVRRLVGDLQALPDFGDGLPALPVVAEPSLPAQVADLRPDVRSARLALESADRRTAAALARRFPALRLSADLVSVENSFGDLFGRSFWFVGAGLTRPLFDAGALRAAQSQAESVAEEALYGYANAVLNAFVDVQSAMDRNVTQARVLESLAVQSRTARAVLELATEAYRQGSAAYLDVLTALQSSQQIEQQVVGARAQQIVNRIQLCRALGIGIGPHAPEA